jgi:uroporphyrinogen-III synthase
MRERRFSILSTSALPFERIQPIPEMVDLSVVPFIKIIPRPSVELMPEISMLASEKRTVVFTSAHAVKFVAGMLKNKPEWKIYCTRNETRIAVINWFGGDSIADFASNARMLSHHMIRDGVKEAVFFCGDQRMDILPDILTKYGVGLTELIVYDTSLTAVHLETQPDAIMFFSPTAVRSFFSMNTLSGNTRIFAMGKTTADALKELTSEPIIISPESDKVFVLNMAVEYAASHPIT